MYEKGLFIFHNDLRTSDNIGLFHASKECKELYVCFIFTPEQAGNSNKYRSNNAIQFMIESLEDLADEVDKCGGKLNFFYAHQNRIIEEYITTLKIECLYFNRFYTPYAMNRDKEASQICKKHNIECKMYDEYYLYTIGSITGSGGEVYKKFTPFYEKVLHIKVDNPVKKQLHNIVKTKTNFDNTITLDEAFRKFVKHNPNILVHGGRNNGLKQLKKSLVEQKDYDNTRDFLNNNTSHLSAYIKFGCLSIREVYHAYKDKYGVKHELLRQLIWRDFYANLLYAYPETMNHSYTFKNLKWKKSKVEFEKWCDGETGVPMVDASMRQLNSTGYMHNRGRMVVANFLVKTLFIDWREGAQYFAQKLTDYDVANNSLNWQNIASTGVYSTPYFRDMSPWIQSKKFDKDAEFIKKWIPQLKTVESKDIHNWETAYKLDKYKSLHYPKPIVEYSEEKKRVLSYYSDCK